MAAQPVDTPGPQPEPHDGKYGDVTWRDRAACLGANLDLFFPTGRGSHDELYAFRVCATCPTIDECLDEALSTRPSDDYGVWGMTSERDRARIRFGMTSVAAVHARNRARIRILQEVS